MGKGLKTILVILGILLLVWVLILIIAMSKANTILRLLSSYGTTAGSGVTWLFILLIVINILKAIACFSLASTLQLDDFATYSYVNTRAKSVESQVNKTLDAQIKKLSPVESKMWACKNCGAINEGRSSQCSNCRANRPTPKVQEEKVIEHE